jgi:hypothetical protein
VVNMDMPWADPHGYLTNTTITRSRTRSRTWCGPTPFSSSSPCIGSPCPGHEEVHRRGLHARAGEDLRG